VQVESLRQRCGGAALLGRRRERLRVGEGIRVLLHSE